MDGLPIDISVYVDEQSIVWPGDPKVEFKKFLSLEANDEVNATALNACIHTGTHIDAPLHHIKDGTSVDQIDLDVLIGQARVVEVSGVKEITAEDLSKSIQDVSGVKRLLLKTDNTNLSSDRFHEDFAALTQDAAQWIVDQGIKLVGIDYFSIQRFHDGPEVHQILLEANVVILEGINLSSVSQGDFHLFCLPMKLRGVEAAPVRAILYPL